MTTEIIDEYRKEAEIGIDKLVSEVLYAGRIYANKEEVDEVLRVLAGLRDYIETQEFEIEKELSDLVGDEG